MVWEEELLFASERSEARRCAQAEDIGARDRELSSETAGHAAIRNDCSQKLFADLLWIGALKV